MGERLYAHPADSLVGRIVDAFISDGDNLAILICLSHIVVNNFNVGLYLFYYTELVYGLLLIALSWVQYYAWEVWTVR